MDHRPDPVLFARRYIFEAGECLYRDHRGRRVLADWEGPGRATCNAGPANVVFEPSLVEGFSENGGCATSPSQGASSIHLLLGPRETLPSSQGVVSSHAGSVTGGGWVVHCEGPLRVDGRREWAPVPSPETPVPYLFRAEAARMDVSARPFRATLLDHFAIGDANALSERGFQVQNISDRTTLASVFADGTPHAAELASHLNTASWTLSIPSGAHAVILRKVYDRFHGRQRARVLLDGRHAGWWYDPVEDRTCRWAVSDFLIPSDLCSAGEHNIAVDPVAGSPLWSVSTIEVFAVERA